MGKRITDLKTKLAQAEAALAESRERHRRATALVGGLVRADRERTEEAARLARLKRDQERREREAKAEAVRRKARAERLEALRRGEVKLTNGDIVSVDHEAGAIDTFTLTLALDGDEANALHDYVRERCRPKPRGASFGLSFADELRAAFAGPFGI